MVAVRAEREVELYPIQHDFVFDERHFVAFVAGRNSGKTIAGSWKAVIRAQQGGLGIIAAPDFPMLEFGAKRAFFDRLREIGAHFDHNKQLGVVTIPRWGAEVRFATLETESRVRGPNYDWAWIDELDYLADRGIWLALKGAVRAGPAPQAFATSTPKGRRLIHEEWVEGATADHAMYKATTRDNPFIDAEQYISSLGYTGRFARQEIEAEFVGAEGLVYLEWSRDRMRSVVCADWRAVLGVDIGTRNPTAILTLRGEPERRHVERELYRGGMSSEEIIAAIEAEADRVRPERIYIDPSAAAYIETLRRHGYPAVKANNDVAYGIGMVATALAEGMTVDPGCTKLAAELESYHYPDNREHDDKPVKEHDHACDALRYGIASEGRRMTGQLAY